MYSGEYADRNCVENYKNKTLVLINWNILFKIHYMLCEHGCKGVWAHVCVHVCVPQNSRSCPSQFPPCRQGQQQASASLAANRPNLDPQGQHSVHVCVCVFLGFITAYVTV